MRLAVNKEYKLENGRKGFCHKLEDHNKDVYLVRVDGMEATSERGFGYFGDGSFAGDPAAYFGMDIVSEWHEEPIRTVTRKEIVTGVYGKIRIIDSTEQSVRLSLMYSGFDASDLRNASKLFIELADALEENNRSSS